MVTSTSEGLNLRMREETGRSRTDGGVERKTVSLPERRYKWLTEECMYIIFSIVSV